MGCKVSIRVYACVCARAHELEQLTVLSLKNTPVTEYSRFPFERLFDPLFLLLVQTLTHSLTHSLTQSHSLDAGAWWWATLPVCLPMPRDDGLVRHVSLNVQGEGPGVR